MINSGIIITKNIFIHARDSLIWFCEHFDLSDPLLVVDFLTNWGEFNIEETLNFDARVQI